MFNGKESKKELEQLVNASNNIGLGTIVTGNIVTKGNIRIEGEVIGNIETSAKISIGEEAIITGNIIAQNAELAGKVKGNVLVSDLLILKPSSLVTGDIETAKLAVETGATFNGKCKMHSLEKVKGEK